MKKIVLIATCFVLLLGSCSEKKEDVNSMSSTAKKNLAAMKGIIKCFEKKNFSNLGDYVAEDCIDHYMEGDLKGLAKMKAEYEKWIGMSDNSPITSKVEFANDEYVLIWTSFEETMKIDAMGMKKGQVFKKTDMEMARFKDGKAVEHWTFIEPAVMMQMMGQTKPAPATDKTK